MVTLEAVVRDLRVALRGLRRSPGFVAAAVSCLALGIGAATAVFSVANASMIQPLPVVQPDRLVLFQWTGRDGAELVAPRSSSGIGDLSLPYAAVAAFARESRSLAGVLGFARLGFDRSSVTVADGTQSVAASGEMVSASYFPVLGVGAAIGRPILERDLEAGAPNVVALSHAFWQRHFGGDPSVVGRTLSLNGESFTVAGVVEARFRGLDPAAAPDLWIPLREYRRLRPWGLPFDPDSVSPFQDPSYFWCIIGGRLKPGVTAEAAIAELDPLLGRLVSADRAEQPKPEQLPHLAATSLSLGMDGLRRHLAKPVQILGAGVVLLLIIACTNVATLLLARGQSRQREIGIRLAIGSSRARIVQQLLVESLLLALAGGLAGLLLARWISPLLLRLLVRPDTATGVEPVIDGAVLGFSLLVSIATGVLFGLAPARAAGRIDVASRLRRESGATGSRARGGRVLIVAQVALSVVLLVGAGLFVRTLLRLGGQDLGFDSQNILLFQIDPERAGYDRTASTALLRQVIERIGAVPGVEAVTASGVALLSGWSSNSPMATDGPPPPSGRPPQAFWNTVGPDFHRTLGIPLVLGRAISGREVWGSERVAVVNRRWAETFFPGRSPLGHRLVTGQTYDAAKSYEIIGVVEDAKYDRLRRESAPTAYIPFTASSHHSARLWVEVRTAGSPQALVAAVREAVRSVDAALPLINLRTQRQQVDLALSQERMMAQVASSFALLALVLVGAGLFGLLAYTVNQRVPEIGVRMALGARTASVVTMVLRDAVGLVGLGLLVGLPVALLATRGIRALLFGVTPTDGVATLGTVVLLTGAALAAALPPALRAARVNPSRALRGE